MVNVIYNSFGLLSSYGHNCIENLNINKTFKCKEVPTYVQHRNGMRTI